MSGGNGVIFFFFSFSSTNPASCCATDLKSTCVELASQLQMKFVNYITDTYVC